MPPLRLTSAAAAVASLLLAIPARCDETTCLLASGGRSVVSIAVAGTARQRTRAAAGTLAAQLRRISGATFELQVSGEVGSVVVGTVADFPRFAAELPLEPREDERETFLLRSHAGGVWVIGTTELAVEHAVWDLLYRIGYRQFFPGPTWEVVPQAQDLSVSVDVVERPSYLSRHIWYGYGPWDYAREPYQDWCEKNLATNGIELDTGHIGELLRHRYADIFKEHPEYLALVEGQRTSDKFCISNPGLRKLVVDHALDHFASQPHGDSLSVEPSDGLGWCECAECAKLGSPSDRAVFLANEVATAVSEKHPGKWFGMYAYGGHVAPPNIGVHPRIVVSVATAFGSAGLTLDELMSGWQARGATIGVREYFSVHPWDRDVPGGAGGWSSARGSDLDYLARTIPRFHKRGARFFSAESSDNWGLCGRAHSPFAEPLIFCRISVYAEVSPTRSFFTLMFRGTHVQFVRAS
ncbi:MAG: DUF4838 domain-containing protein, partial [Planctomycetes bacterium]|nr:DUF4838 domain-containing protein [Planctomycetota bacterium]